MRAGAVVLRADIESVVVSFSSNSHTDSQLFASIVFDLSYGGSPFELSHIQYFPELFGNVQTNCETGNVQTQAILCQSAAFLICVSCVGWAMPLGVGLCMIRFRSVLLSF